MRKCKISSNGGKVWCFQRVHKKSCHGQRKPTQTSARHVVPIKISALPTPLSTLEKEQEAASRVGNKEANQAPFSTDGGSI